MLIAFEGIDGAGKTTQVHGLLARMREARIAATATKEPTSGKWGTIIRRSAASGRLPLHEELHAFIEDRKEHVRDLISPTLEAGEILLIDRYYISTVAYQGARGMDPDEVFRRNGFAPVPDILFVLDVPPQVGLARVSGRGDVPDLFEKEEELALARSIFANRELLRRHLGEFHILDGTLPESEIAETVSALVAAKLNRSSAPLNSADEGCAPSSADLSLA